MLNTQLFPFQCKTCKKTFQSALGLNGHLKVHSSKYEESKAKIGNARTKRALYLYKVAGLLYEENPKVCEHCHENIPYEKFVSHNHVRFCSQSCSAKVNNKKRGERSPETKALIGKGIRAAVELRPVADKISSAGSNKAVRFFKRSVVGAFSKTYRCKCKHCGLVSICSKIRKYCVAHADMYLDAGRNVYEFTINPFKFPDIFSAATLKDLRDNGFWSPSNKNGLTRDHKVSVNEAIKHGYPPHYIKHPLNCEIMSWQENNVKKARSSMSYDDLKKAVDEYEAKKFQL